LSVGEAVMRELKLIGTVMDTKCRLPFVSFGDANQIVGSPKIDFREDVRGAQAVEEVWDQR